MATSPRESVVAHSLTQSHHNPAPDANPMQTGTVAVPFRELHPLARVRALRTMADRTPGVDRRGREVLTALALRSDADGRAEVGQVRIALEAGCSERTARSRLATLARVGLLHRTRSGPRGLTRYTLACPTVDVLDGPTAARVQTGTGTPTERPGRPPGAATGTDGQTGKPNALDARQGPREGGEGNGHATDPQRPPTPASGDHGQTGTDTRPRPPVTPSDRRQGAYDSQRLRPAPPVFVRPGRPARLGAAEGIGNKEPTPRTETGGTSVPFDAIRDTLNRESRGKLPSALGPDRARAIELLAIAHGITLERFAMLGRWYGDGPGADGLRFTPSLAWLVDGDGTRLLERLERAEQWDRGRARRVTEDAGRLAALRREPAGPRVTASDVAALRSRLGRTAMAG